MSPSLDFERDGRDWPNAASSQFVSAARLNWHVQQSGNGPVLLALHGTGASTHSFRDLAPRLAERFTVIAPDLPGHGFTSRPSPGQLSLPGMARALRELLDALNASPEIVVGHSAGAAIGAQMCLDAAITPSRLVSLNGAFMPFRGITGEVFPRMARMLVMNPLVPKMFSRAASNPNRVEKLIRETGSALDERGHSLYRRLFSNTDHVAATLGMMANWDLGPLVRALPRLECPLTLVVGENDHAVQPRDADEIKSRVKGAEVVRLPGLGHLAHEEDPDGVAKLIFDLFF